jgi:hypothetical protein
MSWFGVGEAKKTSSAAPKRAAPKQKRALSAYNKFVKACSKTPEAVTLSGNDMMKHCAKQWKKLTDAQKASYK